MAKFHYSSKLTKKEQDKLLLDFCYVISRLSDTKKAAQFIKDLLSPQEAEMLAKRVKIAQYLVAGESYKFIQDSLKVGAGTIARVNRWLRHSGEGYRFVAKCLIKKRKEELKKIEKWEQSQYSEWSRLKRRYPLMFWPQLLIEEIIRMADKRQKQKLLSTLKKMKDKPKLYKEIERIIQQNFHT